ncbi:MAG: HEAT repeat domain-containing protein [Planctomycetaceae bacterium]|nr:HEAT repeat domain-containing protein [Planctomycetaceae bacterium]
MSWYLRLTFLLLSLSLTLFARERGALAEDAGPVEPQVSPASREGELAKAGIKVPEGIEVSLYAAEPLLANPVAFGFDSQGRIYVCETFRQQQGVEDNRSHMVWLEDDLAARSVADRVAFFRKHLGEGIADYGKQQDRIRRLEDTNRDGVADISTVFAGPFREIEEGTGAGVLAVGDDVYYTNIPRLWRLKDADGNGVADEQDALADGFGVRVAFRGHDMHGLTLGPDGRIYFSIGDRGYNVTTQEGKRLVRPDTGAVFRCERDGSNLEVFAYGLRNPQELAFDDYGNLFTGDNNSDSGDQARWVHVVEGSDTGWRMYFQYLPDRGPWNRERMWYAHQADDETTRVQPTYIVPPITNIADGPSGLAYYPGVGLPDRYNGHFFLADFRGSTSRSGVRSFGLEPHGATYKLTDEHWFIENLLVTDVDFGYDGKMYVTDWVDGWNGPGKGRIYAFTSPAQADAVREAKVADRVSLGFDAGETSELVSLLSHPDRRVRQGAQMALAHHDDVEPLTNLAVDRNSPRIARIHAIWGAWQMAIEKGGIDLHFADIFPRLAADNDPEIRAQALRVFGDLRDAGAVDALIRATQHGTPREQYFAAIALGRIGSENMMDGRERLDAFCELLAKNNDADPVLRHAAVMGLTGCGTPALLLERIDHESAAVRLGAVLALRRHHAGEVAQFLHDADRGRRRSRAGDPRRRLDPRRAAGVGG